MSKLLACVFLLLAVCFSPLALSRNGNTRNAANSFPQKYLAIKGVKNEQLPSPPALRKYGAFFYSILEESRAHAFIFLYNSKGRPFSTIEFNKDTERGEVVYSIALPGTEIAWAKIGTQNSLSGVLYTTSTSSGRTMKVKVALAPEKQASNYACEAGKKEIQTVSVYDENRWKSVVISPFLGEKNIARQNEEDKSGILGSEEAKLFATLKVVACSLAGKIQHGEGVPTGFSTFVGEQR